MLRSVTRFEVDDLLREAKNAQRKRASLTLHRVGEALQRTVTALVPGTYIPPRRHENPDKVALFSIVRGKIAVLQFDDRGRVEEILMLDGQGDTKIVDIAPRTFYSLIPLEPSVILEIVEGHAIADEQKLVASWSPEEGNAKVGDFLMYLTSIVENWKF
jgi:cupin fold WbuC family metalloprotein